MAQLFSPASVCNCCAVSDAWATTEHDSLFCKSNGCIKLTGVKAYKHLFLLNWVDTAVPALEAMNTWMEQQSWRHGLGVRNAVLSSWKWAGRALETSETNRLCTGKQTFKSATNLALIHPQEICCCWNRAKLHLGITWCSFSKNQLAWLCHGWTGSWNHVLRSSPSPGAKTSYSCIQGKTAPASCTAPKQV